MTQIFMILQCMFSTRPYERKEDANKGNEFPFFNKALSDLYMPSGKEKLQAILKNGHNWSLEDEKLFIRIVKTRVAGGKPFSVPGTEDILKAFDLPTFKSQVLLLVAEKAPKLFSEWVLYFSLLEAVPLNKLSVDEKIYLSRSFYNGLLAGYKKSEIAQFIDVSIRLKEQTGSALFLALYQAPITDKLQSKLKHYITICELLISLEDVDALPIIRQHFPKLDALILALEKAHAKPEEKSTNIDVILQRWGTKDDFVKFSLPSKEIQQLKTYYSLMESESKALNLSPFELKEEAKVTALALSSEPQKMFRLIALVREAMNHILGSSPYPEQILAVLALLQRPAHMKGRLAKIRTGEGKSRILALLAAIGALQNRCVDIITSNHYLAMHAQTQFNPFFQLLGVSAGHICMEQPEKKDFDHLILYGTHHDIEFSILRDETYHAEKRYTTVNSTLIRRRFDELWVDEVDVMLLDAQRDSARIALENPKALSWVYCPLMQFVTENVTKTKLLNVGVDGQHALSQDSIAKIKKTLLTSATVEEARRFLAEFSPFKNAENALNSIKILHWLESAFQALYVYQLDQDYTIKMSKIIIMDDKVTGRASAANCRMFHGLHEMLEIIHKLPVGEETLNCASISHSSLFERYQFLGGLTGTVGSEVEREELFETYQVGSFDVPPRFANKRVLYKPLYFKDWPEYFNALEEESAKITAQKRPVLIIFESIKETEFFAKILRKKKIMMQVINEKQKEDEEYLVSRAGYPGMITIATFTAGRGTDVILTAEALANGGVHVFFATFSSNERAEEQGLGRAGRQGQPGSAQLILCEKQAFIQELLTPRGLSLVGDHNFMTKLEQLRAEEADKLSRGRRIYCQFDRIQHCILKEFWSLLQNYRQKMLAIHVAALAEKCTQIKADFRQVPESPLLIPFKNEVNRANEMVLHFWNFKSTDWLVLIKKIHEMYCEKMIDKSLQEWAVFFTDINDVELIMPPLYEALLQANFQNFLRNHLLEFQQPEKHFLQFLTLVFKNNSQQILLPENTSSVVMKGVTFHQLPKEQRAASKTDAPTLEH